MANAEQNVDAARDPGRHVTLTYWDPEDATFWSGPGRRIAGRNLWISIPNLLCAFAVWLYWSIIIVQMQNLHALGFFPFAADKSLLYTLPAIAGLAGATLRIPNSFMIAISGGRNVIFVTTLMLVAPALGVGLALQQADTTWLTFALLACLSGVGGGAFASSMSNISFFYPKRVQGASLGLNAGLGNVGVSVMQVLLPFVMTFGLFGALGGGSQTLPSELGGGEVWIQNCGLIWVPILLVLAVLAFLFMNNLPRHNVPATPVAVGKMLWLELLGFAGAAVGVFLLVSDWGDFPDLAKVFVVLVAAVTVTLALMRYLTPRTTKENLRGQFAIFNEKHNWIMTWLYTMTFGSFIGYSAAFPKLIQDVFGTLPDGSLNPDAPNPLHYAWLGPLVGSLIRPVGGWLSDRMGGARVTQWDTVVMILAALGVAWCVQASRGVEQPEVYWWPFLLLFLLLFTTTGIGNGSTFRMIPIIFKPEQAGPVLGWTSAIAAYGAFLIPRIFGMQIKAGHAEYALYGFAAYYVSCLIVNWWFYARKNAESRAEEAMKSRIITVILHVGILLVGVSLLSALGRYHLPGNNQDYRPVQPLEYSHRVHAGELAIPCLYCHAGAEESRHAGVPSVNICMNCHKYVTASLGAIREEERRAGEEGREPRTLISPELQKLYDALALDAAMTRDPTREPAPIEWVRVHKLPDFVAFDHRPHVTAGVACQTCHGPMESMERARQFSDLSMGWCVQCHRQSGGTRIAGRPVDPSLDCATCHY